jgi:hypothetical protein
MLKWLAVLSIWVTTASGAPAWTWVDANGQVHYSDRPVPGAKQIELPGAQSFGAPRQAPQPTTPGPAASAPTRQDRGQPYRAITIISPTQQQTLWNIGATLNVQVSLDPSLQAGHRLDVYLDGQRKNLDSTSTQLSVPDVPRGVHTMQAVVVDTTGMEVVRSVATTFMVQQTSLLNPNNPNAANSPNAANPASVQNRASNGGGTPPRRSGN